MVQAFIHSEEGYLKGRRLNNIRSFYETPVDSKSLGIFLVESKPSDEEEMFLLTEVECKAVAFRIGEDILLMPMLHSCL